MRSIATLAILLIALLQLGFLVLEMFLWQTSIGLHIFHTTAAFAHESAVLAANQGLYNGFLAAGLLWGLFRGNREFCVFFLACVIVAGAFGAATVNFGVLFIQALPAVVALVAVLSSNNTQAQTTWYFIRHWQRRKRE